MDGVKRYIATGVSQVLGGEFPAHERLVFSSDFDAALTREAALREELASLTTRYQSDCTELSDRLTAAEQRNVALETAIRHALDDSAEDAQTGKITIMQLDYETLATLIDEPTESGASE